MSKLLGVNVNTQSCCVNGVTVVSVLVSVLTVFHEFHDFLRILLNFTEFNCTGQCLTVPAVFDCGDGCVSTGIGVGCVNTGIGVGCVSTGIWCRLCQYRRVYADMHQHHDVCTTTLTRVPPHHRLQCFSEPRVHAVVQQAQWCSPGSFWYQEQTSKIVHFLTPFSDQNPKKSTENNRFYCFIDTLSDA